MTSLLFLAVQFSAPRPFRISDLLSADQARVEKILGPMEKVRFAPGVYFHTPGFSNIRLDTVGAKMSDADFYFDSLPGWPGALKQFGLSSAGVRTKTLPVPGGTVQMARNHVELLGVKGVPINPNTKHPWKVEYQENAVANKARVKALRPQILKASGKERMALIVSCYDWHSEIHFTAGG